MPHDGSSTTEYLTTAESARLGAMYSVVASDSVTACMNAKYHFAFWRPYTAVHDADTDGNPATVPDPEWGPTRGDTRTSRISGQSWLRHRGNHGYAGGVLRDR